MAVTEVYEIYEGRSGQIGKVTDGRNTRNWDVRTDDSTMTSLQVIAGATSLGTSNGATVPTFGTQDPAHPILTCRMVTAKQRSNALDWRIQAKYSSEPLTEEEEEEEDEDNPLLRPAVIERATVTKQVQILLDRDGKPLLNSAGDAYGPQIIDVDIPYYRVKKNVASEPSVFTSLANKSNSGSFAINGNTEDAETLILRPGSIGGKQTENEVEFHVWEFEIHYDPDKWYIDLLDEGLNYLDGGDKKPILIDGEPARTLQPLDGSGGILASPTADNAQYNSFKPRKLADWSGLTAYVT